MLFAVDNDFAVDQLIFYYKTNFRPEIKEQYILGYLLRLFDGDFGELVLFQPVVADCQIGMPAVINPLIEESVIRPTRQFLDNRAEILRDHAA